MSRTLKYDSSSQFWGKFEGIWGNPGEIPHVGWKIRGVLKVKVRLWWLGAVPTQICVFSIVF